MLFLYVIYIIIIIEANNNIISWNSQLQKTVALSTCKAKYYYLKEAIREGIYLFNLFQYFNIELKLNYNMPIPKILLDNNSAIKLAENLEFHKRIKHIDIIYYYNREAVNNNKVSIIYIPIKE